MSRINSAPKTYFINKYMSFDPPENPEDIVEFLKRRAGEVAEVVIKNQGTNLADCSDGPYAGVAGPAYMCFYLSRLQEFSHKREEFLAKAVEYIDAAKFKQQLNFSDNDYELLYEEFLDFQTLEDILEFVVEKDDQEFNQNEDEIKILNGKQEAAYLLGNSGVLVVAALVYDVNGLVEKRNEAITRFISAAEICKPVDKLLCGGDEMLVGRAGYLCGCLILNKFLDSNTVSQEIMLAVCKSIIKSGQDYTQKNMSVSPLMYSYGQVEYLGAGHGLSGILQILLAIPECLDNDKNAESDVKASVDFILSLQTPSGNFPPALDELGHHARPESDELVHWCHGAPGVIYMLARAYLRWKDPRYLDSCRKCGDLIWERGLLRKGPGICHGVSGSGYAFLLLYKLTGEEIHLYRAKKFAEFMYEPEFENARTPDCLYSLYEGLAGMACYLADLIHPEFAHFPLFDDIPMVTRKED
ncbi:LanC-like protein 3 [Nymphon striatum]|nr:LanC-like protein 3 [Nymphon striatum]